MNALCRRCRDYQVPRSLQDSARSERLPELHIEVPSGRSASDQALPDDAFSHCFIMTSNRGKRLAWATPQLNELLTELLIWLGDHEYDSIRQTQGSMSRNSAAAAGV